MVWEGQHSENCKENCLCIMSEQPKLNPEISEFRTCSQNFEQTFGTCILKVGGQCFLTRQVTK